MNYLITIIFILYSSAAVAEGDYERGKSLFHMCSACHVGASSSGSSAPSLSNVFGRKSGSLDDYRYSRAMSNSNLIWDETTLDQFLAAPQQLVRGNKMPFSGLKSPQERHDIIQFLKSSRLSP